VNGFGRIFPKRAKGVEISVGCKTIKLFGISLEARCVFLLTLPLSPWKINGWNAKMADFPFQFG